MYNETEYIYQQFEKNFGGKKEEPLVLYGTGKNTEKLLPQIQDFHIVGLMDGKKKEGIIWGKPILDYNDVVALNVKTIVIIARPAIIGVIYHRIAEFCTQNNIMVYDVRGNDLSMVYRNQEINIPYFRQSFEDLEKEVRRYDIISFDIFDTLIMRKVLYPADIFTIVEKRKPFPGFASLRIEAERQLYEEKQNPNFAEIYERIQQLSGISREEGEKLQELELEVEMELITPRERMLELFNHIKNEKKIYLISDMYLPQKAIVKLLEKCGYEGYKEIYVSCEKRTAKQEALFEMYLEDREKDGYSCGNCLHIGDNETADFMSAKAAGMNAFQIMSAREILESSSYRSLLDSDLNFMDHLAVGLLCAKAFGDPFVLYGTKGKLRITDVRNFAYMLIAPTILYATVWIMQQVRKLECDYILYPSRDAYLVEKLSNEICEKQVEHNFAEGEYFYTSRRAVVAATIWKVADIYHVAGYQANGCCIAGMDFSGSIHQLFQKRFHINIESEAKELKADDGGKLKFYLNKYQQEILERGRKERENYLHYISGTGIPAHRKIAFIDFLAAGKVQCGLEKLLPGKEFLGLYFLRREPNVGELDRDIKVETFFPSKGAFEMDVNVGRYYLFLEMVLTSPEATFDYIDDDGKICFMEETRTKEHLDIVDKIQESILKYTEEFSELYPDLLHAQVDYHISDMILGFLDKEYTNLDMQDVTSLVLTDEFLSQTFNIFQT